MTDPNTINHFRSERDRLDKTNRELVEALGIALRVINDFLPNVGRCALQNYKELNDILVVGPRAIAKANGTTP